LSEPSARSATPESRTASPTRRSFPSGSSRSSQVLYLVFNEGYLASDGEVAERRELARDAEWLTSLLVRLMPDESEPLGLLALIRLHMARVEARFGPDGSLILLPDQDRSRWDAAAIAAAAALVERGLRMGRPGQYLLQAAIVAVHATAPSYAETDWAEIVALYDRLLQLQATPVVALNRALALAELAGPGAALAEIEPLAPRLDGYLPVSRGARRAPATDGASRRGWGGEPAGPVAHRESSGAAPPRGAPQARGHLTTS